MGRSGDHGVYLLVAAGDTTIAAQVKHHRKADRVEGVAPVREFVSALVHQGRPAGIFVTTGKKFSKPAHDYAGDIKRTYCPLVLVDLPDVMTMLNLNAQRSGAYKRLLRGDKVDRRGVWQGWDE